MGNNTDLELSVEDLTTLRRFVPVQQMRTLQEQLVGPEASFFREVATDLLKTFHEMPKIGVDESGGDSAIVHFHYFSLTSGDWWITERDASGANCMFGLCDLGCPEFGYVHMPDLLRSSLVESDFHWKKRPVGEIHEERLFSA